MVSQPRTNFYIQIPKKAAVEKLKLIIKVQIFWLHNLKPLTMGEKSLCKKTKQNPKKGHF